jgi:hypothetical protein
MLLEDGGERGEGRREEVERVPYKDEEEVLIIVASRLKIN